MKNRRMATAYSPGHARGSGRRGRPAVKEQRFRCTVVALPDTTFRHAPGWPGIPPRWTSSVKNGVGTAMSASSKVWFTISHGILDEIYFPRVDSACTRDLGLLVTDGS